MYKIKLNEPELKDIKNSIKKEKNVKIYRRPPKFDDEKRRAEEYFHKRYSWSHQRLPDGLVQVIYRRGA